MKILIILLNLLFAYLLYFFESFTIVIGITGSGAGLDGFNEKYGNLPNYIYYSLALIHVLLFSYFFKSSKLIKVTAIFLIVLIYFYCIFFSDFFKIFFF
ncbi:hypothetical protein SAMN05421847_0795 [Halpernia humi]|uniref:Uncharacterized protein n=1 Tax=Halpernia humi TaxID=493375 RepID=A0A1H5UH44_9FLAO|nr:hypothetical protein SAMN05421847_0795 [Halpernia humi]